MLERGKRLTAPRDFTEVYKRGRQVSSSNLRLSYLSVNQNISRFGFVVANKLARTLVERNKIKRRLRVETGKLFPHLAPGFNVVIQARGRLGALSSQEIGEELKIIFKRARLWQDS